MYGSLRISTQKKKEFEHVEDVPKKRKNKMTTLFSSFIIEEGKREIQTEDIAPETSKRNK